MSGIQKSLTGKGNDPGASRAPGGAVTSKKGQEKNKTPLKLSFDKSPTRGKAPEPARQESPSSTASKGKQQGRWKPARRLLVLDALDEDRVMRMHGGRLVASATYGCISRSLPPRGLSSSVMQGKRVMPFELFTDAVLPCVL
jgi:hypothetical protein